MAFPAELAYPKVGATRVGENQSLPSTLPASHGSGAWLEGTGRAMAMTTEQIAQALATQNEQIARALTGMSDLMTSLQASMGGSTESRPDGKIVGKYFRSDVFSGTQTQWDDWSFAFKRCVRSQSPETFKEMVVWEAATDDVDEETELPEAMEKRSAELYDVLCQYCTGEALMIVRSVDDMRGIRAWQKLFKKYNPKTMARGLRVLVEAVNPPKAKGLHDVESAVARWEEKSKILATQFGEKLSDRMKMGIFTSIMPIVIQDYIYTHVEKDTEYEELKEKVRSMVSNKITAGVGPAPMDIGDVKGQGDEWGYEYEDGHGDEHEVDVVYGDYRCRNCGGYGHFARECPSKGKGKCKGGDKGKGKGFPKGGVAKGSGWGAKGDGKGFGKASYGHGAKGKGQFQNDNGKGKGYQGTCWNCGKVGHKANECTARDAAHVEEAEETVEVEGMWDVSNVVAAEAAPPWEVVAPRGRFRSGRRTATGSESPRTPGEPGKAAGDAPPLTAGGPWKRTVWRRTATARIADKEAREDFRVETRNRFARLEEGDGDGGEVCEVGEVGEVRVGDGEAWTRLSSMTFNIAGVCKPLASAAKVVAMGNRVVLDPDPAKSCVENVRTGEKMRLREQKGVYVFDVKYQDGEEGTITLDSGAGVSVWPKEWARYATETGPKKPGLKMVAANGTPIENVGQARVVFKGRTPQPFRGQSW